MRPKVNRRIVVRCVLAAAAGAALAYSPWASATNGTWINGSTGGLWSAAANWSPGGGSGVIANGTDAIADLSTLNITADNTVHLDSARTIGSMVFGDLTTASNNWILDNNGNAANILTLAVSSGTPAIRVNNQTTTITAVVAGSQGFNATGAGTLVLSGNNTFTGGVSILAGTVRLGNANALGSTANGTSVASGTILDLGGQSVAAENITSIQGTGIGGLGALVNTSVNPASLSGNVTLAGATTIGAGNITLSGIVSANTITKTGAGTLTLGGASDNNGLGLVVNAGTVVLGKTSSSSVHAIGGPGITISGGTVQLGGSGGDQIFNNAAVTLNSGTFDLNGQSEAFDGFSGTGGIVTNTVAATTSTMTVGAFSSSGTFSGVIQDGAKGKTVALTKTGTGTLTLSGANTYSGATTVSQGTLAAGTNNVLSPNSAVTVAAGAVLDLVAVNYLQENTESIGSLAGAGTIESSVGGFNLEVGLDNTSTTFSGTFASGPGYYILQKSGTGTLTLSGVSNVSETDINAGTLRLGSANVYPAGSLLIVRTGGTLDLSGLAITDASGWWEIYGSGAGGASTLVNSSATPASLAEPINPSNSGAFSVGGTGNITLNGGFNPFGGTSVLTKIGTNTLILSGTLDNPGLSVIVNSGTVVLAKTSKAGVHSIGGGLTIAGGLVQLQGTGGDQISDSASVTVNGGLFDLNANNETIDALNGSGGIISNSAAATTSTLTVGAGNGSGAYSGIIQNGAGIMALTKTGTGTQTLSGANSYTGPTIISVGMLKAGAANALASGSAFGIAVDATLDLGGFNQSIGSLFGAGNVTNSAAATSRTLTVGNDNSSTSFTGPITNGAGTLALTKVGAGALALSGVNTFTGNLTISGGNLTLNGGSLAADVSNQASFTYNSGIFNGFLTNFGTCTFNADFIAAGGIQNFAFLTIPSNRTVTANGAGLENEGTLTFVGGVLANSGPADNFSQIIGHGMIVGPGALSNFNVLNASSGDLQILAGVAFTNTGLIENSVGSNLFIDSTTVSHSGSIIVNGAGSVVFSQPISNISGRTVQLLGGILATPTLTNASGGSITGFGQITGSLVNAGSVSIFGPSQIVGNLINQATGTFAVTNIQTIITGTGLNQGTIHVTGGKLIFIGAFTNTGTYITDPSINIFQSNVSISSTGTMTGSTGDEFHFAGGTVSNSGTFNNGGLLQSSTNIANTGAFTQTGPQAWASGTTFTNNAGTLTFGSDTGSISASPLAIVVHGGSVALAASQHFTSLTITGGTVSISAGTTRTNALVFGGSANSWTGDLDLTTHKLIAQATSITKATVLSDLQNQVNYGKTHAAGITSSAMPGNMAIAVIDNGGLTTPLATFGGEAVDGNSILVAPELLGDANADGIVNRADFETLANHFGASNAGWVGADFNGDGVTGFADFALLSNNFNAVIGLPFTANQAAGASGDVQVAGIAGVPEPASLAILGLAEIALLRGRRTRVR